VCDDERSLLRDIQKLIRLTLPAFDRRNDRALGALAAVQKTTMPEPVQRQPAHGRGAPPKASRNRRRGRPNQGQGARQPMSGPRQIASTQPVARWSPVD
jgi:ATP-dependent RNA helicase RhlE